MKLLVIGGTVFVGRAVVEEARTRGWEVTLFHRGEHGAALFPDVERVRGDRARDLGKLAGRRWDLVVDTCGYVPSEVAASARALAGAVDRYVFVSSASVYRDWPRVAPDEGSAPLFPPRDDDGGHYGQQKSGCERAAEAALPGRVVHARAGLITGPHENIGRLPYWLERLSRPGPALAPGRPGATIQLIDVRDLARFLLDAPPGPYNLVSEPGRFTMGELLETCRDAAGAGASLVWVDDETLLAAKAEPWTGLPMWVPPRPDLAAAYAIPTARAVRAGLVCRPLAQTVRDAWTALAAEGLSSWRADLRPTGLPAGLEERLLRPHG
jgi:nucleoside-diphosphate-sugar epimerase